jgi:hypothetical protein
MFQFPGFAFVPYEFRYKYLLVISVSPKTCLSFLTRHDDQKMLCASSSLFGITEIVGGFPHSEIRGSKLVRSSPRHIAAYHVLHRLSAPRHPPNTLKALDRSHYQCPPLGSGASPLQRSRIDRKTSLLQTHPRTLRSRDAHSWLLAIDRTLSSIKSDRMHFLFTMTDSTHFARSVNAKPLKDDPSSVAAINHLVEPDGIEPTTSCLQSTRSPN